MRHEGFHGRSGFGGRPALLVIDMSVGFTDPRSPLACALDDVVVAIERLLGQARDAGLPVIYTTVAYDDAGRRTAAVFIEKVPALLTLEAGSRWTEIDPRLSPRPGEPVLTKLFASAFHGTPLATLLATEGCDGVIVTGASTSGCVRATAVDALQHGYRVVVPREAVGDRNPAAHEASLYDVDAKYGDVLPLAEVLEHLERLVPAGAGAR
ncbi:MAG TPA: isochorismatase family protein [Gaiellaceae bacterium]|nr:isochorismatase family protein [Gaiellaceae bacterium]